MVFPTLLESGNCIAYVKDEGNDWQYLSYERDVLVFMLKFINNGIHPHLTHDNGSQPNDI